MSKEVSCRPIAAILNAIKDKNIQDEIWLRGIPYSIEYLNNIYERIEWSVLCKLFKNIRPYFSDEEFIKIGRDYMKSSISRHVRLFIKIVYSRTGLYNFMRDHMYKDGIQYFTCIDLILEPVGKNGFRQTLTVKDGYEYVREWFVVTRGSLSYFPFILGYKSSNTNLKWIERGAIIEVTCPERKTFTSRLKNLFLSPIHGRQAALELHEAHEKLLQRYKEIDKAHLELQRQATQLETTYEISQVIHKGLDLETTVQAIARALVEIAGYSGACVKLAIDTEGNQLIREKSFGVTPASSESFVKPLLISDNKIGEITLWLSANDNRKNTEELLTRILPIISMALHDAHTHSVVIDYQNNLENKVKERTTELQNARDDLNDTVELLKKAQSARDRFFANISHEFRTPLTLIFGPANDVIEKTKEHDTKKNVGIIKRNATRLYDLVNQLLDLSKLESGKMKLEASERNIIPLLKGIVLSFTSFAERKKITLKFNTIEENLMLYIDKDIVGKIINNLLFNAFKFTPEGGKIDLTVKKLMNDIEIRITDNGIGIPNERIDRIFDRFYQVEGSHIRRGEGTGIGLALTKELVELHKGKIKVESKEGGGTTFSVLLPLGKDCFNPDEIIKKESKDIAESYFEESELVPESYREEEKTEIDVLLKNDKPLLLIVEDNSDVRNYIISHLEEVYRIQEAVNGEDGLEQSLKHIPDLIISDVMMPKMDGFEMCYKLKTDERTSHIPIIMLTAKATSKDKIEGYETGADDYIMKPFEVKELSARISNLIEQRKRLCKHFRKKGVFEIDDKTITSVDKKFLYKLNEIISKHLSDTSFSVDIFSEEIGISRSQLHRKLVALVGEPPSDLIRRIRLSKAAKLIEKKFGNISEIALEVGFSNPANFSYSFRKQFGMSPSEYENRPKG